MSSRITAQSATVAQRSNEHHDLSPRHGNAASPAVDEAVRDMVRSSRPATQALRLPEPGPAHSAQDQTWTPRPRSVEELRARFRESAVQERRLASGNSVDWQGRRLTDFDLDEQKERQRMPEPMPSSWLSPVKPAPPSAFLRNLGGLLMGLSVGLALAVPGVLWHKGRIDPLAVIGLTAADLGLAMAAPVAATSIKVTTPAAEPPRVARVPVEVARESVPVVTPPSAPAKAAVAPEPMPRATPTASTMVVLQPVPVEAAPAQPEPPRSEILLSDARRLIGEGDLPAARQKLEDQALATNATARFLLAETFDPNFLAARGIRSVRAEVPRAIELYREALDGGMDAARQRLSALRP